ncbi:ATP-binding protein [Myxococcota bacterium]|nr:ATP-binding protein [Myxococcota bacterium]
MAGPSQAPGTVGLVAGQRVRHPVLGEGGVARVLDGGRKALVRFDLRPAVPAVVAADTLQPLSSAPAPPAPPSPPAARPTPQDPPDRQSLEALRLGVVPARGLDALTVGRHEELGRLDALLQQARGMLVLSGGYGTGKTHLVELAEAAGLHRGFLVARATFDPLEVPPSHPLRLYGALLRDLRHPGGASGLRPLLERVGDSDEHLHGAQAHRWLSPALFAALHAPPELADEVLDFVSGQGHDDHQQLSRDLRRLGFRGPPMLGLPDYRTFGQVMAHLLGGLAVWARDAGHAGLLVLLDEAEYLDRLGHTSREMAENVLRYLAMAALPPERLAFHEGGVYKGGQAAHREVPPRYRPDQPLAVVCAFTPDPQVDRVLARILADPADRLRLDPVRPSLLPVLAEKVYGLVKAVYPQLDPAPEHRQRVTRALDQAFRSGQVDSTRQAARLVVEFWDLYRQDPARALRALHGADAAAPR